MTHEEQTARLYNAAMRVETAAEANRILANLACLLVEASGQTPEDALHIVRENLGYHAGYYGNETRERVERLFECEHPFFGKISEKGPPSPEEALRLGMELGEKWRRERDERGG